MIVESSVQQCEPATDEAATSRRGSAGSVDQEETRDAAEEGGGCLFPTRISFHSVYNY